MRLHAKGGFGFIQKLTFGQNPFAISRSRLQEYVDLHVFFAHKLPLKFRTKPFLIMVRPVLVFWHINFREGFPENEKKTDLTKTKKGCDQFSRNLWEWLLDFVHSHFPSLPPPFPSRSLCRPPTFGPACMVLWLARFGHSLPYRAILHGWRRAILCASPWFYGLSVWSHAIPIWAFACLCGPPA